MNTICVRYASKMDMKHFRIVITYCALSQNSRNVLIEYNHKPSIAMILPSYLNAICRQRISNLWYFHTLKELRGECIVLSTEMVEKIFCCYIVNVLTFSCVNVSKNRMKRKSN